MSKQVGTKNRKKKNFRLRKSVRRTLGALFMISAIIVAAIPFPDAEAADPSLPPPPVTAPTGATLNYSVTTDATINDKAKTGVDLDPSGKTPLEAFTLRQDDSGVWIYEKQFDYYVTGTNKAIISKYNSTYSVNNITLTNRVNGGSYITETQANFDAYFANSDAGKMVTLTFADKGTPEEERFKYYFPLKYNEYLALYQQYQQGVTDGTNTPSSTAVTVTADPTKDLSTANANIKGEFYADYVAETGKLKGLGCYMEYVEKATGNSTGAIYEGMYVARLRTGTSDNIGSGYRSDNQGFLYSGLTSYDLVGIGNRAFENVKNVSTITLPETLQYIGDYAFSGSFVEVIAIKNVEEIGNHAFESSLLRDISWGTKTIRIGTEAFRNTNLVNVSLPYSIMSIGEGAFSHNSSLASVKFDTTAVTDISILKYAFFNCPDLGSISLKEVRVKEIGEGAFALNTLETGNCVRFEFPALLEDPNKLGDLILSGRMNLKEVLMPAMMGVNGTAELKPNLFYGCANLACVEFPAENGSCGYVEFPANLFASVTNDEFYVLGPEMNRANQTASPRTSTWECVNGKGEAIPYMYVSGGKTFYEVKSGDYLLTLDINNANKTASVSKCDFAPGVTSTTTGELSIPDNVGPYKIVKLADGCITPEVKADIKNLTIGNSITEVGAGVFQDCTNMLTLDVGDSVTAIGANAFKGCTSLASANIGGSVTKLGASAFEGCIKLENISFEPPVGGTASFPVQNIGDKALTTGSNKLTINAVAAKEYGPFAYSMDPANYVNEGLGVRIYYRTPEPSKLGIILDNRNNYPTLVDYPKFEDLKNIEVDDVDDLGQTTGTTTNLLDKYQSGKTLTPAEEALINATLFLEIPDGVDSIDVRGYLTSTSPQTVDGNSGKVVTNRNSVAAYFSGADYPYRAAYEGYGLFTGKMADANAAVETEERGDDNLRSVVMRSVRYLPESDIPTTSDGTGNALRSGGAFYSCEGLERVDLGSQMEEIQGLPFLDCTSLHTVDSTSPKFECINKILYENITSTDGDGNQVTTKKLVECLPSRGMAGDAVINSETDPNLAGVAEIGEGALMRCFKLGFVDLSGTHPLLKTIPEDTFREDDGLVEVILPEHVRILKNGAFEETAQNVRVYIHGREVDIEDKAFNVNPAIVYTYKDTAAYNAASKIPNVSVMPLSDSYRVAFISGYDGSMIKEQFVEEGGRADAPEDKDIPAVTGMTFSKWSTDAYKNVTENLTVVALYVPGDGSGGTGGGTGGGPGGSGGTGGGTGGAGGSGNGEYDANGNRLYTLTVTGGSGSGKYAAGTTLSVTANAATDGKAFTHWSSNQNIIFSDPTKVTASFAMPAADTTVTANYAGQFNLTVKHGSGGGSYPAGAKVEIEASPAAAGTSFLRWTGTGNVQIASVSSAKTSLIMPAADTTVTANYTNSGSAGGSGTGGSNTTGTGSNNRTSIIITKPGFSDTNQASAYVTGSSDGFIVRITESAEATQAALEALQRQYSDMNPIKFFAMDISLYDSTGTQKITDTTGLKINITIPIPDDLRPYLGNNKIAAVANGSLEPLAVKFVTINGVPCMSFTATHFSPYTVYVDTGNLTLSDNLDVTPKTGDGIHPKWFLSLGLASISMILFLKKDRKYRTSIS